MASRGNGLVTLPRLVEGVGWPGFGRDRQACVSASSGCPMLEEQPVETTLYSLATVPPGMPERRNDERHMTLLRVGSLIIGDRRELCLIRNISAGGMLVRIYSAVTPGTRVAIELKQGEAVEGTILWSKDELVGVSFDAPIDILSLISAPADARRPRMPRLEVDC